MARESSLLRRLQKLYDEANLPKDSLIHRPGSKIKAEGDGTFGVVGGGKLTKEELARHKKLSTNLRRALKRKPDFIC